MTKAERKPQRQPVIEVSRSKPVNFEPLFTEEDIISRAKQIFGRLVFENLTPGDLQFLNEKYHNDRRFEYRKSGESLHILNAHSAHRFIIASITIKEEGAQSEKEINSDPQYLRTLYLLGQGEESIISVGIKFDANSDSRVFISEMGKITPVMQAPHDVQRRFAQTVDLI